MSKKHTIAFLMSPSVGELNLPDIAGTERMFLKDLKIAAPAFSTQAFARFSYKQIQKIYFPRFLVRFGHVLSQRVAWLGQFLYFISELAYCISFFRHAGKVDKILSYSFPLIALFAPKKTIVFLHHHPNFYFAKLLKNRYEKAQFVFCSRFLKNEVEAAYPFIRFSSHVLYNSVDTTMFKPESHVDKRKRNQKLKLLYCSAWVKEKGLDVLLESIAMLPGHLRKKVELTISSSPGLWFQEFKESNQAYVNKVNSLVETLANVTLLNGVAYTDMPKLYNEHDYVVFPSNWNEPFGLVVLESLSSGTPVIATHNGGIPEIISPKNSVKLPEVTVACLRSVIEKLVHTVDLDQKRMPRRSLLQEKNTLMRDEERTKRFLELLA